MRGGFCRVIKLLKKIPADVFPVSAGGGSVCGEPRECRSGLRFVSFVVVFAILLLHFAKRICIKHVIDLKTSF